MIMVTLSGGACVAARVERMRVGGVEVLVETVTVAGTEPTSAVDAVRDKAEDMFGKAKDTIVAFGESTAEVVRRLAVSSVARPSSVEVEFELGFTARGGIVVAGSEASAALRVKLAYEVAGTGVPGHAAASEDGASVAGSAV
jgi:hypothetical protein